MVGVSVALIVLPLLWIGNRIVTGHFIPRTPYDVVILGLLVMVLVSLYATYDIAVSLPKIAGVLLGVSAFYVVVGFIDAPKQLYQVLIVVSAGRGDFLGSGVRRFQLGKQDRRAAAVSARLPSLLRGLPGADTGFHPAEVGGTLDLACFLPAAVAIGLWPHTPIASGPWLIGLSGLSGVLLLALVLTQSRSAWLGVAAGGGRSAVVVGSLGARGAVGVVVVVLIITVRVGVPDRFAVKRQADLSDG